MMRGLKNTIIATETVGAVQTFVNLGQYSLTEILDALIEVQSMQGNEAAYADLIAEIISKTSVNGTSFGDKCFEKLIFYCTDRMHCNRARNFCHFIDELFLRDIVDDNCVMLCLKLLESECQSYDGLDILFEKVVSKLQNKANPNLKSFLENLKKIYESCTGNQLSFLNDFMKDYQEYFN